ARAGGAGWYRMVMKMIGYETVSHFVFTLFYDRLGHCSDRHLPPGYYRVHFERGGSWFNFFGVEQSSAGGWLCFLVLWLEPSGYAECLAQNQGHRLGGYPT